MKTEFPPKAGLKISLVSFSNSVVYKKIKNYNFFLALVVKGTHSESKIFDLKYVHVVL